MTGTDKPEDTQPSAGEGAAPDAPEAAAIRTAADRVKITFQFGGEFIDFGLYLLHKPPI